MRLQHRVVVVLAVAAAALALPGAARAQLNQWHPVNLSIDGTTPSAMVSLPGHPNSLYVATNGGFQRSTDGGATWAAQTTTSCQANTIAVDPNDPMTVYLGCGIGVQKSTDGGATWSPANQGLTDPNHTPSVQTVVIDPADSTTVYATTGFDTLGDIFVSHDSGGTWSPIHSGSGATALAISGSRLYAYSGGLITSDDGGTSWSAPSAGAAFKLVADPGTPGTVYAVITQTTQGGVSMTTDGGQTWTSLATAPPDISDAAVQNGTLYLATANGVWATSDQGQSWVDTDVQFGHALQATALAADPAETGHLWIGAANYDGIWEVTVNGSLEDGSVPYYMAGTLPATSLTPTSAVLNGVVAATVPQVTGQYWFEWGTAPSFGNATVTESFPASTQAGAEANVSATLTGLTPNTTYYVQLNGLANWIGGNGSSTPALTFKTPPAPPVVTTPPAVTFLDAPVPGTGVPTRVSWAVKAGTRTVCSNTLQRSVDGHNYANVALASQDAHSFSTVLAPDHPYQYRVRATDCSNLSGGWTTGAVATVHRTSSAPAAAFGPKWHVVSGGAHESAIAGARATFAFTGRAVALIGFRGSAYGRAAVYLDGKQVATVDLHAASPSQRRVLYAHSYAAAGHHTLALVVLADPGHQAVAVDSFAFTS